MQKHILRRVKSHIFTSLFAFVMALVIAPATVFADSNTVKAEEVEVNPDTGSDTATIGTKALEATKTGVAKGTDAVVSGSGKAWDATKSGVTKGSEAVVSGSGKAWDATKSGVSKGTEAVVSGSGKAWSATKKATKSAVEFTGEKATEAGNLIKGVVSGSGDKAPVTDKSIGG